MDATRHTAVLGSVFPKPGGTNFNNKGGSLLLIRLSWLWVADSYGKLSAILGGLVILVQKEFEISTGERPVGLPTSAWLTIEKGLRLKTRYIDS